MHRTPGLAVLLSLSLLALGCDPEGGGDGGPANPGATAPPGAPAGPGPGADGASTPAAGGPIERIGLYQTYEAFTGIVFKPVLLLRDGKACECADEDLDALDMTAIAAKRPNDLGTWRVGAERDEVQWAGKPEWEGLSKVAVIAITPFTTKTTYSRTSSIGTAGSGNWVGAEKGFTFEPGGRFSFAGGVATETTAQTNKTAGTYAMKGYMMTLTFGDGTTQRLSALTGADKPGGLLWLDGAVYTK